MISFNKKAAEQIETNPPIFYQLALYLETVYNTIKLKIV